MTLSGELFQVADASCAALALARSDDLQKPLSRLRVVCEQAKRAWSGSNLGYHANVYWDDLEPKPPDVQFSSEWGLMDSWPVHSPAEGWCQMDQHAVIADIIDRAGRPNIEAIRNSLELIRENFCSLKEQAVSLLSASLSANDDLFIRRKLRQVDELGVADPDTIAASLVPSGQTISRDMTAITQGGQIAPHQRLMGVYLSATVAENGLDALEKASREAASHLLRLEKITRRSQTVGTNVFIGHGRSLVWRDLKDFIKDRLQLPYDEFNRVPVAGITNIARLSEMLDAAAVAFIVLTGEDEQADGELRARMNVIHEAGLFQGRLGFTKAIVLLEDGCADFSNIEGLGQIRFPKGNIGAKFEEIRLVLEREGLLND